MIVLLNYTYLILIVVGIIMGVLCTSVEGRIIHLYQCGRGVRCVRVW